MGTYGDTLLELRDVCKSFSDIHILKNINLSFYVGEVHVLLGENGAGKSTLIKLISGAHHTDRGEILWKGRPIDIKGPGDAMDIGVSTIYQELNLIPELTVYENIFIGRELKKNNMNFLLDINTMKEKAAEYIEQLGMDISPDAKVSSLGMGQKQLVEIAKALSMDAKLIIMDEPTSSLSESEIERLIGTVQNLKKQGISIIYISHKLEELKRIGDRISVLRDGCVIGTYSMKESTTEKMVQLMVGRTLNEKYPKAHVTVGQEGFRVEELQLKGSVKKVSFTAFRGQVLGISGLVGAGRTELARGIFGVDPIEGGSVYVAGKKEIIESPRDALRAGLAFIPENRKEEGLILDKSLEFNMSLASLHHCHFIKTTDLRNRSERYLNELQIHPKDITIDVGKLSGGNQQKVVISKWLLTNAKVYIFDEPTRGVDVGAKVEVYHILNSLVECGAVVLVISSELPEILGMCDRVLVMKEGEIMGDFLTKETDQEMIMRAATGGITCKH